LLLVINILGENMKLKQIIQVAVIGVSVVTLAACSTGRKHNGQDVNSQNEAYNATTNGVGDDASFGDQAGGRRVSSNGRVYYFDYDSNAVHEADKPAIVSNATKLASSSGKAMLEGHTDPRGSREYNIGLGERRAKSVAQVMATNGVSANQLRIVSYGAEKPASPGASEADYQQDRRVVLVYPQG
jgi:peptidoglycan-associated lipoprotein